MNDSLSWIILALLCILLFVILTGIGFLEEIRDLIKEQNRLIQEPEQEPEDPADYWKNDDS